MEEKTGTPIPTVAQYSGPPDGGYGWVCIVAVFFINGFTWGIVASFGVFLAYYLNSNHFPGGNPTNYALIGSITFAIPTLIAPFATLLCRRFHWRWTLIAGVFCTSGGFIAASFSTKIWQLFLSQGALTGIGVGLIYVPSLPIVSQWFDKKRSLVNGIASAGSGVGGLAMSFAVQAMIQNLGIGWALRIVGIVVFAVTLPAAIALRDRDNYILPTRKMFDLSLFRRYDFILLLGWSFIMMFGYITLTYSLSAYGRAIGLSSDQASYQTAFMNLGIILGRPFTGFLSDRFGTIEVPCMFTFVTGVLCFALWIPARSYGLLTFFSILGGSMMGIFWPALGPVTTEVVGLKDLHSGLSVIWVVIVPPVLVSELIALKLRRQNSSYPYLYAQIFSGISYLVASLCMLELARVVRKRRRLERVELVE